MFLAVGKIENQDVYADVTDLSEFINSDGDIFVSDSDGNQFTVKKISVEWVSCQAVEPIR